MTATKIIAMRIARATSKKRIALLYYIGFARPQCF
jgi:hypothetical protein